ncbi:MAG: hypothetical protein RBR71_11140 [Gudongella sp.]|jgi:hypothetical protein|nr:hypothetical protein [Gudongella sp.]
MIHIFNRREVCVVFSIKEQARIREVLSKNNINYRIRTVNRMSSSAFSAGTRSKTGAFAQDIDKVYEYTFYVHKKDYDRAKSIIS